MHKRTFTEHSISFPVQTITLGLQQSARIKARGYLANKLRVSGAEVVILSPAPTLHSPALWQNHVVSARGLRSFFASISTGISLIYSLLVPYFSPLSTGPINNNYKVYK